MIIPTKFHGSWCQKTGDDLDEEDFYNLAGNFLIQRGQIVVIKNFIEMGNKVTTMTKIDGKNCSIELVGRSMSTIVPCTVLITNEIIIVRTAACTVKLSVAPNGELHEDIFAQDACEQYPDVRAQLNIYAPQAEEDGFFDRVRDSVESLRSSILESQFAESLDAGALTITKDIRKTIIDVRETLGKEATDVAHQCIFLKHSIENFPKKVAEEVQTVEKSFLITTYKAADAVQGEYECLKDKITNLPELARQRLETKIVDLGHCIENSCQNVTTKVLLNNIEKNISEMNSKVSKLTSDITKTAEQPTENINIILQEVEKLKSTLQAGPISAKIAKSLEQVDSTISCATKVLSEDKHLRDLAESLTTQLHSAKKALPTIVSEFGELVGKENLGETFSNALSPNRDDIVNLDKDSKVDLAHHLSSLKNTVGAICDRVEKSMDVKKNISKLQKKLEKSVEKLKKQVRKQSGELTNEIAVTAARKLEDLNIDLNFPHNQMAPNNHHQQVQSSLQTIGLGGYCFFEQLRSAGQFGLITLPFTVFTIY